VVGGGVEVGASARSDCRPPDPSGGLGLSACPLRGLYNAGPSPKGRRTSSSFSNGGGRDYSDHPTELPFCC